MTNETNRGPWWWYVFFKTTDWPTLEAELVQRGFSFGPYVLGAGTIRVLAFATSEQLGQWREEKKETGPYAWEEAGDV